MAFATSIVSEKVSTVRGKARGKPNETLPFKAWRLLGTNLELDQDQEVAERLSAVVKIIAPPTFGSAPSAFR
jgi:hypothetical protein